MNIFKKPTKEQIFSSEEKILAQLNLSFDKLVDSNQDLQKILHISRSGILENFLNQNTNLPMTKQKNY